MASDRELEAWMGSKGISRQNLSADNLSAAQNLAKNLGIKGSGKNGEFTQEDSDIWGMSQGFVPNFTKKKPDSKVGKDAILLREIINDLDESPEYKYKSLKDLTRKYVGRFSGKPESFMTKLSRFRGAKTTGIREGINPEEASKLTKLLNEKIPLGQTGKRPKMYKDLNMDIIEDMMNGSIKPLEAAKKHGHGVKGGSDHNVIKQFKKQLLAEKKTEAYQYVLDHTKNKDHFKDDRALSKHLGINFQRGESKPNIDIPTGAVDEEKLKDIGLGLSGLTTNWEAKKSLQHLKGKGIRQMLFEHRNKPGGLIDIVNSFDSKNPGLTEARNIDITTQFGGALAIPGTRGKNYPTGISTQLSTFKFKDMDSILKQKFGNQKEIAKKNKSILAEIMVEEYDLASQGFIPNYNLKLGDKYFSEREVIKAIQMLYLDRVEEKLDKKLAEQAAIRYTSLINDAGGQRYPGGKIEIGGETFNPNEVALALQGHGQFYRPKEGETIPNYANLIFDKDRISSKSKDILEGILSSNKRKNLLMGPSGVGKSTLASSYGEFIQSLEDLQRASSYTILSGAGKTKSGGMSPALEEVINAVNSSGGKVSFLSASDETIEKRRQSRIDSPMKGDLRSEKQLKGTKYAPKNQPEFTEAVRRAARQFEIINTANGLIPNFAFGEKIKWNKDAKTKKWGLSASAFDLSSFGNYLMEVSKKDPKMVSPKAAQKFIERAESFRAIVAKEKEDVHKNTPIGFGRQGRKHYDAMSFVSERSRNVDLDGIFIKNLKGHVKQFNKHGSLFAADKLGGYDSFVNQGFIPNFYNLNRRDLSDGDEMSDDQRLLKMWQDKMGEVKKLADQIKQGGARIELDPIISKLNEDASRIWEELQKLRKGQDYYIPNYANPLSEAISREQAAGIPASKIKIEKSSQLKSPQNPMGLAVTNTRDEPGGVAQGIRRAKSMGIDPKKHGMSAGFVPNYVMGIAGTEGFGQGSLNKPKLKGPASGFSKELEQATDKVREFVSHIELYNQRQKQQSDSSEKVTESNEKQSKSVGDSMMRLFMLQRHSQYGKWLSARICRNRNRGFQKICGIRFRCQQSFKYVYSIKRKLGGCFKHFSMIKMAKIWLKNSAIKRV